MCKAKIAAQMIHLWCANKFPDKDGKKMSSTMADHLMGVIEHTSSGTYKYIPADRLTVDLGESVGSGVFGYYRMEDSSYILLTCDGRLAYWTGKEEDKACWAE